MRGPTDDVQPEHADAFARDLQRTVGARLEHEHRLRHRGRSPRSVRASWREPISSSLVTSIVTPSRSSRLCSAANICTRPAFMSKTPGPVIRSPSTRERPARQACPSARRCRDARAARPAARPICQRRWTRPSTVDALRLPADPSLRDVGDDVGATRDRVEVVRRRLAADQLGEVVDQRRRGRVAGVAHAHIRFGVASRVNSRAKKTACRRAARAARGTPTGLVIGPANATGRCATAAGAGGVRRDDRRAVPARSPPTRPTGTGTPRGGVRAGSAASPAAARHERTAHGVADGGAVVDGRRRPASRRPAYGPRW